VNSKEKVKLLLREGPGWALPFFFLGPGTPVPCLDSRDPGPKSAVGWHSRAFWPLVVQVTGELAGK